MSVAEVALALLVFMCVHCVFPYMYVKVATLTV